MTIDRKRAAERAGGRTSEVGPCGDLVLGEGTQSIRRLLHRDDLHISEITSTEEEMQIVMGDIPACYPSGGTCACTHVSCFSSCVLQEDSEVRTIHHRIVLHRIDVLFLLHRGHVCVDSDQ